MISLYSLTNAFMRFSCLLILLCIFLSVSPAYGQRKAKVDTVAAFRAFNEGRRLEKEAQYDSSITHFQLAAEGYKAYALSLPEKQKHVASKKRAWEQHFMALIHIVQSQKKSENYEQGLAIMRKAKTDCSKLLGDTNLVMAVIDEKIGTILYFQGHYDQSLESFKTVLQLKQGAYGLAHIEVAKVHNKLGLAYLNNGQYSQAMVEFNQTLSIAQKVAGIEHELVSLSYNHLGIIYYYQAEYDKALLNYEQSLAIRKRVLGDIHSDVADVYNNIGLVYAYQGFLEKASHSYHMTLSIYQKSNSTNYKAIADGYNNLAILYQEQGQNAKAIESHQQALSIRIQHFGKQHPTVAISYVNLGHIYVSQGNFKQAIEHFEQALAISLQTYGDQHPTTGSIYNGIGNSYYIQKKYLQALEYYERSKTISQLAFGESEIQTMIDYQSIADTYADMGDSEKALALYQKVLTTLTQKLGKEHPEVAEICHRIGFTYLNRGHYSNAIDFFHQSLQGYLPDYGSSKYSSLRTNRINVLEAPITNLAQALFLRKARGDDTLALSTVRFADRLIDSLRKVFTYENDKLELGETANKLYALAIEVANWNKQSEEAFYYAEKNKAAVLAQSLNEATALKLGGIPDSLVEQDKAFRLKVAFYTKASMDELINCPQCDSAILLTLNNALISYQQQHVALKVRLESDYPQYYSLKYKQQHFSVKEIQEGYLQANPTSAILEYLLSDSVLYAFCITQNNYVLHRQKLDSTPFKHINSLILQVKKLGRALADENLYLDSTTAVSQPASILYDYLIKPFEAEVKDKDLIIIPDAELNQIPFELLMKPLANLSKSQKWQDLPYLLKTHNISYHYSVNLLIEEWQKTKTQPTKSSGFVGLAPVFLSVAESENRDRLFSDAQAAKRMEQQPRFYAYLNDLSTYKPLPGTEREIKAIYELFNQQNQPAKYYLNDQANESTVKSINLKPFKYIHFATHGLTDEDRPTNSCLILAQKADSTADNLLTSSEMYGLELDAELVVLSACQTGKGTLKAGEGIIGLTRGLLYAGARNLMVSQWNVNDASTAELMTKFYSKVLAGQSNRQALREAKLELLNSQFACPHYWSAFVLVGR